ncbi:MAG: BNR-repeat neuraminidase N-terminal domain-containing protein, partial [Flexibacteraceae bacterium]
ISGSGIRTYGIVAGPRVFAGITIDQPSASIQSTNPGVVNTALVRVKIDVNGTLGSVFLTKLVANLTGTVNAAQITRPRINTTLNRPTFTSPIILGNVAQNFSGGTVTFSAATSGSGWPIALNPGANYIWLTVNVEANASPGAVIDATITEISVSKNSGVDSIRTISTPNPSGALVVLNTMNFESGDQGFANASSNTTFWTRTTLPAAGTTPNSLNTGFSTASDPYPGYRAGNTGTQVWGTNAFNTPAASVGLGNQDLLSPIFVAQGTSVNFSFWNWWALESATFAFDEVIFEYSINGGAWTNASTNANGPNKNIPTAGWKQRTITVPTTSGQTVQLRFRYEGDGVIEAGYFFDDFQVDAPFLSDVTAPTIAMGTVDNTPSRANRTLTGLATIADPNPGFGVNTSTTLRPRLFYKRSTDANNSSGWKSVAANNTTSPYSFTIDYTLLNGGTGVSVGNVIQYFVVAQDNAPTPNVGVTPGVTISGTRTSVNLSPTNLLLIGGTIPTYEIVNGPLSLDSVLVTHPNTTATRGSSNQILSRVELQVGGSLNSLNLTALTVNSNSTTITTTNIGNVRLFYTNNTTFSTATPVGSAVTLTGTGTTATMVFTGLSQALSGGSNYIWVTADIPADATINAALDVQQAINSVTVSDGTTTTTLPRVAKSPTGTVNVTLPVLPNLAYTVTRSTGIEYTSIVGQEGTSTFGFPALSSRDDAMSPNIDLSTIFTGFQFQGETLNRIGISTNGHLQFNNDFGTLNNLGNTVAIRKAFVPINDDLYCSTTDPNNHHFWRVDGTPGNRVFTAEWISMEQFTHAGPDLNFQVKLYEADDRIEFVYGTMVGFNGSVNKAYDYTLGIFGGVTGTSQTTGTPLAGQYLSQRFENTNNFQNNTFTSTLASIPACNSRITFTPSASFTNGTSTAPTISNNFCGAARPLSLTFGAQIDNCNVYRSALYSGTAPTPAACTTGVASGDDDAAWFSFYNDSPRDIVILVNASGGYAPAIQLASNCSTALACTTTTTAGGIMQLNYTGLGVGTFYVRVHHNGSGAFTTPTNGGLGTGNFTMSIYTTASAPINDTCGGAITLTPNAAETLGSTLNATSQATSPAGTGSGADPDDDDVWYKFTATTTSATILSRGVSPFIPVVEVWRTACPNNTTATTERLLLSNPNLATQQSNLLTGLTVGQTYYIRVYHRATGAPASGSRQFYLQVSLPRPSCPVVNTT